MQINQNRMASATLEAPRFDGSEMNGRNRAPDSQSASGRQAANAGGFGRRVWSAGRGRAAAGDSTAGGWHIVTVPRRRSHRCRCGQSSVGCGSGSSGWKSDRGRGNAGGRCHEIDSRNIQRRQSVTKMNGRCRGRLASESGMECYKNCLCSVGFPTQADATIRSRRRGRCGQVERSGTVATLPTAATALRMVSGCGGMPT